MSPLRLHHQVEGDGTEEPGLTEPGCSVPGAEHHDGALPVPGTEENDAQDRYRAGDADLVPAQEADGTGTGADDRISTVGRAVAQWAAEQSTACAATVLTALQAHLEKPGTMANTVWYHRPRSLAAHHEHARSRSWVPGGQDKNGPLGRYGEFTLHTIGRQLKIAGLGLSSLGDSPIGIWAAMILVVVAGVAFAILVIR